MEKVMKRIACGVILVLISIISGPAKAEPALMIREPIFNFGFVPQNSTISHVFWLHSNGTDPLEIIDIKPGCGCTKAPLEKNIIPAGDSARVEIIYSTRKYYGPQSKRPAISSNEGDLKKYLQFTANVFKDPEKTVPIRITPYTFDISQYGEKARRKMEFEIANVSENELELSVVDYPRNMIKIDFPDKIKTGKSEKGKIEIKKEFENVEFEKSITIQLNDQNRTRFTIPIKRVIMIPGQSKY